MDAVNVEMLQRDVDIGNLWRKAKERKTVALAITFYMALLQEEEEEIKVLIDRSESFATGARIRMFIFGCTQIPNRLRQMVNKIRGKMLEFFSYLKVTSVR